MLTRGVLRAAAAMLLAGLAGCGAGPEAAPSPALAGPGCVPAPNAMLAEPDIRAVTLHWLPGNGNARLTGCLLVPSTRRLVYANGAFGVTDRRGGLIGAAGQEATIVEPPPGMSYAVFLSAESQPLGRARIGSRLLFRARIVTALGDARDELTYTAVRDVICQGCPPR